MIFKDKKWRFLRLFLKKLVWYNFGMKLYLVRHGQTDWNLQARKQGRTDIRLNETGRYQAEELRDKIEKAGLKFNYCFSSPLLRAKETAEIILGGKMEVQTDDRLVERCFGELEGTVGPTERDFRGDIWDIRENINIYGLETAGEILARTKDFLEDLIRDYPRDARVLIVAHGGSLKALHFNIVGYDEYTDFSEVHFGNAEMREYDV